MKPGDREAAKAAIVYWMSRENAPKIVDLLSFIRQCPELNMSAILLGFIHLEREGFLVDVSPDRDGMLYSLAEQ